MSKTMEFQLKTHSLSFSSALHSRPNNYTVHATIKKNNNFVFQKKLTILFFKKNYNISLQVC